MVYLPAWTVYALFLFSVSGKVAANKSEGHSTFLSAQERGLDIGKCCVV